MTAPAVREPHRIRIELPDGLSSLTTPTPLYNYEEQMQRQRTEIAKQDRDRFRNPDFDPIGSKQWRVYAFVDMAEDVSQWVYVGWRPVRSNRRKPMTMNRLFASARAKWGIPRHIPIKLVTAQDDDLRIRRGDPHLPPQYFLSRRPDHVS